MSFYVPESEGHDDFLSSLALAVRAGMSREKALEGLTLAAARMLDLQNRIGSLEPGKDGDFRKDLNPASLEVVRAQGLVKKAAALVNAEAGRLPQWKAEAIVRAADEAMYAAKRQGGTPAT